MAQKPGFMNYVAAAFNARPFGMFVAPNWVGLAAMGLLGIANPGFWVLGAGLELGYLLTLATNSRFQRVVASRPLSAARSEWNGRINRLLDRLTGEDRGRYSALAERCASIIELQTHGGADTPHGIEMQADSLGRLSWMFLRLLVARGTILRVLGQGDDDDVLEQRRRALEKQASDESAPADLRRSLEGQIDILGQRIQQRLEADKKLAFIDAELARIEE